MFQHILLCTHGTAGAQKAEKLVFEQLLKNFPETRLTILTIINADWKLMTGDDWLNTSRTRMQFLDHVDGQLTREIEADWERIKTAYPQSTEHRFIEVVGYVEETITEVARRQECDLIVIGPYQKTRSRGFRDRIKNEKFHPLLPCPLLIAP